MPGRLARVGRPTYDLSGVIASAGFESGDRFVVGHWPISPVGPITDVMWAAPDGSRTLLAPSERAARFITAVYTFDRVDVVPITATAALRSLRVEAGELTLELRGGFGVRLPVVRPPWFTRWVEGPVARALLGVRTYGVTPSGVQEWYRAFGYRRVVGGRAVLAGLDLGGLRPVDPPVRFGFSEPPRRPSMVVVRPRLADATGMLERALALG